MDTLTELRGWLRPLGDQMTPLVNLNGSDPDTMVQDRVVAMSDLYKAMDSLGKIKPHGRDYPGRTAAYERDRVIWDQRFATLDALRNVLKDEALAIHAAR